LLDGSVFSSEIGTRKPDRRIFQEALARVGAEPSQTVFVGDRLYDDIGGAHAAGMRGVQTTQFRTEEDAEAKPDAVIVQLSELPDVLRKWGDPPRRGKPRRRPEPRAGGARTGG
jgi:putative hydrolase of the HAD superfamily